MSCPKYADCSGHGYCNNHGCQCLFAWIGQNCSEPLSTLSKTSRFYDPWRWGNLAWYGVLFFYLIYAIATVRKAKQLTWVCISKPPGFPKGEIDPQQVPLLCLMWHAVFTLIAFSTDPLGIHNNAPWSLFVQWLLWYVDGGGLVVACSWIVRVWIELEAQFCAEDARFLRLYDRGLVVVMFIMGASSLLVISCHFFTTPPRTVILVNFSASLVCFWTLSLWMLTLLGCGWTYGRKIIENLKRFPAKNQEETSIHKTLRKILVFLGYMLVILLVYGVTVLGTLISTFREGNQSILIGCQAIVRTCYFVLVITLIRTVGVFPWSRMANDRSGSGLKKKRPSGNNNNTRGSNGKRKSAPKGGLAKLSVDPTVPLRSDGSGASGAGTGNNSGARSSLNSKDPEVEDQALALAQAQAAQQYQYQYRSARSDDSGGILVIPEEVVVTASINNNGSD